MSHLIPVSSFSMVYSYSHSVFHAQPGFIPIQFPVSLVIPIPSDAAASPESHTTVLLHVLWRYHRHFHSVCIN